MPISVAARSKVAGIAGSNPAEGMDVCLLCSELSSGIYCLMMEAVHTSETSVDNHLTRHKNPEDNSEHHTRRRENLKSHICLLCLCVVLSCVGRGLCDGLITRPEGSYRVSYCVCEITETPKGARCSSWEPQENDDDDDDDNYNIVISSQVLFHDGSLLHSKGQCTNVDYN
jgi:hypothetical protein